MLLIGQGRGELRNQDLKMELSAVAAKLTAERVVHAVRKVDEVVGLVRRNVQKVIALDGLLLEIAGT